MWVAASAEAVGEVLTSGLCRVRPAGEAVPSALAGATAGEVFGRLVRMTDGEAHAPLKRAVSVALATVDPGEVASLAAAWAATLWGRDPLAPTSARVTALAFDLSAHVVGDLLGLPRHRLGDVAGWMGGFVRCLAPASTAEQVADGIGAADHLAVLVAASVRPPVGRSPTGSSRPCCGRPGKRGSSTRRWSSRTPWASCRRRTRRRLG
jgi:hypothetical protein